jgi:serine/threonine-protein kinase
MLGKTILGKYQIVRLLDHGGMCNVFLARQADRSREVAVKVLQDPLLKDPKAVEHFRREIFIMARFQHPHAVTYFDAGDLGRAGPVLVMEYLRGTDLNTLVQHEVRFSPQRTGRLLVHLCEALQAAHDAGVIHRDIKLGNLMALYPGTPRELLKLMDFGLAKLTSLLYIAPDELNAYVPPATSGTPEYIAPEQIGGGDGGDPRSDLYSVGVSLFEMLTGRLPFVHQSLERLLEAHQGDEPPAFSEVLGRSHGIAPAVEETVRCCLSKDPRERPQTATQLAEMYCQALGMPLGHVQKPASAAAGSSGFNRILNTDHAAATPGRGSNPTDRLSKVASLAADRHAVRLSVEACMPEAMAMVKLKGFIYDLGGEVIESVPGIIRVRLGEPRPKLPQKPKGLLGWFGGGGGTVTRAAPPTEVEMHMERRDATQPNRLTITLVLRCPGGQVTPEWRDRCQKIGRDLQAYLMGR